jgi:cell wall-associated NlpC family hydrolase
MPAEALHSGSDACHLGGKLMIPLWVENYQQLGFAAGGRARPAVDCWGLVRLVLIEQAGIAVPHYGPHSPNDLLDVAKAVRDNLDDYSRIEDGAEQPFDLVLMTGLVGEGASARNAGVHVGVVIAPGILMHIEKASHHPVCADYRGIRANPALKSRILGFYRKCSP